CFYKKSRKWFSNNKEKYKQWKREYNHRPYVKEKGKIYRENNKKRINKVANSRIQKDPLLQLSIRLNNHLRNCLKHYDYFAKGEMEELLGCSIERFKFHFELYFLKE